MRDLVECGKSFVRQDNVDTARHVDFPRWRHLDVKQSAGSGCHSRLPIVRLVQFEEGITLGIVWYSVSPDTRNEAA